MQLYVQIIHRGIPFSTLFQTNVAISCQLEELEENNQVAINYSKIKKNLLNFNSSENVVMAAILKMTATLSITTTYIIMLLDGNNYIYKV